MDVDYFDYDHYEGLEADGGDNMYGDTFLDFVHNYYNIFDGRLMVLLKHNLIYAWESCIVYTIIEIFKNYIWKLVLWNFLFRIVSSTNSLTSNAKHFFTIFCGIGLVWHLLDIKSVIYLLSFTGLGLFIMKIVDFLATRLNFINESKTKMKTFALFIMSYLLLFANYNWEEIRSVQMIAIMKIVSINLDVELKHISEIPRSLEIVSYMFCPSNILIGPWHSFLEFSSHFLQTDKRKSWKQFSTSILLIIIYILISIGFLILSNCLSAVLASGYISFNLVWLESFSFRTSHYFISYVSQALMILSGFKQMNERTEYKGKLFESEFDYQVTKPFTIEWPRSLVEVVIYWNITMHMWLKTYVFKPIKPHGLIKAILATYIVSALLHGLKSNTSAVLLSLGCMTYVEYNLRKKLAIALSACIESRKCSDDCRNHRYYGSVYWVRLLNFIFKLITIYHLTYLGAIMNQTIQPEDVISEIEEEEYHSSEIILHHLDEYFMGWNELHYTGHILTLIFYIISKLL